MTLHRLSSITIGVPNVTETGDYYGALGLSEVAPGRFATTDGGRQLTLRTTPTRRLLALEVGVDDADDLGRVGAALNRLGLPSSRSEHTLRATEPVSSVEVTLRITPRILQPETATVPVNGRGHTGRANLRAPGVLREGAVRPRKLGHVVIGSPDKAATQRFFTDGIGFKISDEISNLAAFLRCSTDHHNLLVQQAPVNFLHHTSWQVDDVDEVGRGAMDMLRDHPERHVWGLGRHHIGSNFFWYLRDPAGNFTEYYSDLDCILDDQLWKPSVFEGDSSIYSWGPPLPPSMLEPQDLAALMTGSHSAR